MKNYHMNEPYYCRKRGTTVVNVVEPNAVEPVVTFCGPDAIRNADLFMSAVRADDPITGMEMTR